MGRAHSWLPIIQKWKPGQVLFKLKHIRSKSKSLIKYKKLKKHQKISKNNRNRSIKSAMIKSAIENSNTSLQINGKLIFAHNCSLVKINLKTKKTTHQVNFPKHSQYMEGISMCAIPNHKFFCIDFDNSSAFIINKNLKISERKSISPKAFGTLIYLNGLIYLFKNKNFLKIDSYDLNKNRWKKALSLKQYDKCTHSNVVAFEGKIIISPHYAGSVKAFDPFCNSASKILKLNAKSSAMTLAVNDKLYSIQSEGCVFETLPRDYTQWLRIGKCGCVKGIYGLSLYSLYNDSIYFVSVAKYSPALFRFDLKTRKIAYSNEIKLTQNLS